MLSAAINSITRRRVDAMRAYMSTHACARDGCVAKLKACMLLDGYNNYVTLNCVVIGY